MKTSHIACIFLALAAFAVVVESSTSAIKSKKGTGVTLPVAAKPTKLISRLIPKLLEGSGRNISITGNITFWAEFFAQISVGNPPQVFEVQLDTGSTDLLIYGKGCKTCGRTSKYDFQKSSSSARQACHGSPFQCEKCYQTQYCGFQDSYGDGSSVSGFVVTDTLSWGGLSAKVGFGAIENSNVKNFEPTSVDGLMGLAYPDISSWSGPSVFDNIQESNNLYNAFGMCLIPNRATVTLGVDYTSNSAFQWTPITQQQYYSIYLTDVAVGGKSLNIDPSDLNENEVIVDSGTTLLIVSTQVFKAFKKSLEAMCSSVRLPGVCDGGALFQGNCVPMKPSDIAKFPSLSFSAKGAENLAIEGKHYLLENLDDNGNPTGQFCLGIDAQDQIPIILGDVWMQNFNVAFDRVKNKVGFAPISTCP